MSHCHVFKTHCYTSLALTTSQQFHKSNSVIPLKIQVFPLKSHVLNPYHHHLFLLKIIDQFPVHYTTYFSNPLTILQHSKYSVFQLKSKHTQNSLVFIIYLWIFLPMYLLLIIYHLSSIYNLSIY